MSEERFKQIRAGSIKERLAFVAKDSVVYGGAGALNSMLQLLLLPIIARLFTQTEFGALDSMNVLGASFIAFIILGQDSSIARYFYETEDEEERKQIISQALLAEVVVCTAVTSLVWINAAALLEAVYGMSEYVEYFRIMVLSFPLVVMVRFSSNLLKWTFQRGRFIVVAFGASATVISLTVLYVWKLDMGLRGYYLGQVTGFALFAILGLWFCRKYFTVPRGFDRGWEMLSYGGPYMVTAVASCLIPALDRVMITNMVGLEATGLYGMSYRYAFLLMLPIQAFMTAWAPFTLSIYKEDNAEETYNRGLVLATAGLVVLSVVMLSVIEPVIVLVATENYLSGHVVALPLMVGLVIQNISHIAGVGISLSKRTRFTMYSYVIGVVSSAAMIWLLVRDFGILGAAYGALLGRVAQSVSYVAFAYSVYPIRFALTRPLAMVGLLVGSGFALQEVDLETMSTLVLYRAVVVALFATLIWYAMFNASEREKAVASISSYLGRETNET